MANGIPAPAAPILDVLNMSVCGLEEAMQRLNENMLNEPMPTGIMESKSIGTNSRKLNALYDLISRVDNITVGLNQAAMDLSRL